MVMLTRSLLGVWHFMESSYPEIRRDIVEKKMITDSNRANMTKALDAFRHSWQA